MIVAHPHRDEQRVVVRVSKGGRHVEGGTLTGAIRHAAGRAAKERRRDHRPAENPTVGVIQALPDRRGQRRENIGSLVGGHGHGTTGVRSSTVRATGFT